MLFRHEVRKECGTGGGGKGTPRADQKQHGINGEDVVCAPERESKQCNGTEDLKYVAAKDDMAPVKAIRNVTSRQ